jgi:hypothetical protein
MTRAVIVKDCLTVMRTMPASGATLCPLAIGIEIDPNHVTATRGQLNQVVTEAAG